MASPNGPSITSARGPAPPRWLVALFAAWVLLIASAPRATADTAELVVIVHPKNPAAELAPAELRAIFTTSRRRWSSGGAVAPFNLPARTDERVRFDRAVLDMTPEEVSRFWVDRKIRGGEPPPRQVPDASIMLRVVEKLEDAIGYVPRPLAKDARVKVVAVVREGRVEPP